MRLPIYEDELVEHERACCPQCHMPISEDDEEDFGVCETCHNTPTCAICKGEIDPSGPAICPHCEQELIDREMEHLEPEEMEEAA